MPSVSVGPIVMHDVAFEVVPFRAHSEVGLLGCDFLADSIVRIDYRAKKVTLISPDGFDPKSTGATAVPAQYDDCVPHIRASIAGTPGRFLMDTGATTTLLRPGYAHTLHGIELAEANYHTEFYGVGGPQAAAWYTLHDVIVGPVEFKNATGIVPSQDGFLAPDEDGIIGTDVLKAFVIYLDYANNVVYLKPNT